MAVIRCSEWITWYYVLVVTKVHDLLEMSKNSLSSHEDIARQDDDLLSGAVATEGSSGSEAYE